VDGNANVTLHELLIDVTKVRFQLDRYACLTVPVRDPQSVNICQVTAPYSRATSIRRVRLSLYATPTSRSSLQRLYPTFSSKKVFRHVQPPHFISILTISLFYTAMPEHHQKSPRNADTTRHRHRIQHRIRHAGDRATPLRPSTMATRPHTNAAALPPRYAMRCGLTPTPPHHLAVTGQGHHATRDATTRHLLYICCLLIKSAKNLISLLLKKRLFSN